MIARYIVKLLSQNYYYLNRLILLADFSYVASTNAKGKSNEDGHI